MVEKHKLIADFEQLSYDNEMLKKSWNDLFDRFKLLVDSGWTDRRILDFISYIKTTSFVQTLYAGSSMGCLLISKPQNGRLNYQQTLSIKYDNQIDLFIMEYSDWDLIDSKDEAEKAIQWRIKCAGIELAERFQEFIEWNKNWR